MSDNLELTNQQAFEVLLDKIETTTLTERDKGTRFETLTRDWFMHEPTYNDLFTKVQTYKEWAHEHSDLVINERDIGIDLVGTNIIDDKFTAIQCKFYGKGRVVPKPEIDSFVAASSKKFFTHRIIVATNDNWTQNVIDELQDLNPAVTIIKRSDLANSMVDWSAYLTGDVKEIEKRELRDYQREAVKDVIRSFQFYDRGKLIMACGTGKTYTALKIAEEQTNNKGFVLFLVPSLSLLSQTLTDWKQQSNLPLTAFAVCSDSSTGKSDNDDIESLTRTDELAYPATTNAEDLSIQLNEFMPKASGMTVVFSTYQSLEVIANAQHNFGIKDFDLIICDEAHRTAGGNLVNEEESKFVKIHNENYVLGKKRLYMTATPKIYGGDAKDQFEKGDIVLYSMEDEKIYGPVFHSLSFNDAVRLGCLVDYKVIVLGVDESVIGNRYTEVVQEGGLSIPHAAKVIGCWKALSKMDLQTEVSLGDDIAQMKRAVGFAQVIRPSENHDRVSSMQFADHFQNTIEDFKKKILESEKLKDTESQKEFEERNSLTCDCKHIDGQMTSIEKDSLLSWLKDEPADNHCKILFNVRCLSEGVDVPALDAVMFLSPRKSQVDVVQTVGRVMRRAPGKTRGYVIIPIVTPEKMDPKEILNRNKDFSVVWQVLQALKSIDSNFGSIVDGQLGKIDSEKLGIVCISKQSFMPSRNIKKDNKTNVTKRKGGSVKSKKGNIKFEYSLDFEHNEILENSIRSLIVKKVGNRREWEEWAEDVGKICTDQIQQIKSVIDNPNNDFAAKSFKHFKAELCATLNNNISDDDVIEMISQHIIIKPIIDALFKEYPLTKFNPVSKAMTEILESLDSEGMKKANETLGDFYESVRVRMKNIKTAAERQTVILELFDRFFKVAFKKQQEKLGIVFTPIPIVDFINKSVADILQKEFNISIADNNVHVLDPFTGTGTFITRLLQSGVIPKDKLVYKYENELHANEIVPLSYYIASMNIESVFYEITGLSTYKPNNVTILTDTFASNGKSEIFESSLSENNSKIQKVNNADIRVIIGNPPYSAKQENQNDDNQNEHYDLLDKRLEETYVKNSSAGLKNSLYDSYFRAYRWASDRIGDKGVIGFVTNASWIDSASADGVRKCFAEEFSSIYVYHLKGRQINVVGEESKREGGKIFGSGCRAPIAIVLLVKNPKATNKNKISFTTVDDYLTREQKLEQISANKTIYNLSWDEIKPDKHGDWINQRDDSFSNFINIGGSRCSENSVFSTVSWGVKTNRDVWLYNSSEKATERSVKKMLSSYEEVLTKIENGIPDKQAIAEAGQNVSWSAGLLSSLSKKESLNYVDKSIRKSIYRPFFKQSLYYGPRLVERPSKWASIFPNEYSENYVIAVTGGGCKDFTCLMSNCILDIQALFNGQCFPRYTYNEKGEKIDNISPIALAHFKEAYANENIDSSDVFFYIYGLLHSKEYRKKYAFNLIKELPRIPRVKTFEQFKLYAEAGRKLSDLHINYEKVEPYGNCLIEGLDDASSFAVSNMKWGKIPGKTGNDAKDKTILIYNQFITIKNIPIESQEYVVNKRTALDWLVEKAAVDMDKKTGIVNDFNDYAEENHNPKYIFNLVLRLITVSVETMKIVKSLPKLEIHEKDL